MNQKVECREEKGGKETRQSKTLGTLVWRVQGDKEQQCIHTRNDKDKNCFIELGQIPKSSFAKNFEIASVHLTRNQTLEQHLWILCTPLFLLDIQ